MGIDVSMLMVFCAAIAALALGVMLGKVETALRDASGAQHIYMASLNEQWPHYHCHLVPRYENLPEGIKLFDVFDLPALAREGRIVVDPGEVEDLCQRFTKRLAHDS